MARGPLAATLRHIRRLAGIQLADCETDGELLHRFAVQREEAAFAALMQRHGPMVLGVCHRVLGDLHAAEDAFQGTFLVLARRALALHRRGQVAGWLYTVACHLALRVRAREARRRAHEQDKIRAMRPADPPSAEALDLRRFLDAELERLPAKYRMPVVLCYLEGKTNDEAAVQLGWTRGTVAGRLSRARDLLRTRLAGRGLALSTAALATALTEQTAPAAVPAPLALGTSEAAQALVAGQALSQVAAPELASIVEETLRSLHLARLKTGALVLVLALGLCAALAAGVTWGSASRPAGPVYLADLQPSTVNIPDATYFATGGMVLGLESSHNLSLHPRTSGFSSVTYRLDGKYRTFETAAGIRDNPEGGSLRPLTFVVLGDGKVLWKSPELKANGWTESCSVGVAAIDVLELQVHCPGSRWYAWAAWVEPRLLR